jgi:hypothetical protein
MGTEEEKVAKRGLSADLGMAVVPLGMSGWLGHHGFVKPFQGFLDMVGGFVTRGALRDPGLWYGTALRFGMRDGGV